MKIFNTIDCCKPRRRMNFKGQGNSVQRNSKVRYKHFEQMDDATLTAHSVAKAYRDVKKSGKMQILKAVPVIVATVIGTSLVLSQPDKLSAKAARGLGFLALIKTMNKAIDITDAVIDKRVNENEKNSLKTNFIKFGAAVGTALACAIGAVSIAKGANKVLNKFAPSVSNFISSEFQTLGKEINGSKFGSFVNTKVNPFISKHQTKFNVAADIIPYISALGGIYAQEKLRGNLSNDIKNKAQQNYQNAKEIQRMAKENFDNIEAQEV